MSHSIINSSTSGQRKKSISMMMWFSHFRSWSSCVDSTTKNNSIIPWIGETIFVVEKRKNNIRFLVFVAWAFCCVMYHLIIFSSLIASRFDRCTNTRSSEHAQLAKIGQFCNFIGTFPWESYFSRISSIEHKIILMSVFFSLR